MSIMSTLVIVQLSVIIGLLVWITYLYARIDLIKTRYNILMDKWFDALDEIFRLEHQKK